MINVRFSMSLALTAVMKRIERKRLKVLAKTGALGRTVMKRQIRAPKSGRKSRTIDVGGKLYFVPVRGRVVDLATGKQATTAQADAARIALGRRIGREQAGKPPRRGPTDLLRRHMYFGIDEATESVVVGPMIFAKQPRIVGAVSIPELLERGGSESIGSKLVKYDPHPFAAPAMDETERYFRKLIESEPL